jgi:hypothetical protein
MKAIKLNKVLKNAMLGAVMVFTIFSFTSCTRKINFLVSAVVPAARGTIKVTRDQNKNYVINIKLADLAEVERLQPSKNMYVVWMLTEKDATVNMGQVISSEKGLEKKLAVNFRTTTVFKPSKIFITAEDDAAIHYPEGQTILSTDRF